MIAMLFKFLQIMHFVRCMFFAPFEIRRLTCPDVGEHCRYDELASGCDVSHCSMSEKIKLEKTLQDSQEDQRALCSNATQMARTSSRSNVTVGARGAQCYVPMYVCMCLHRKMALSDFIIAKND